MREARAFSRIGRSPNHRAPQTLRIRLLAMMRGTMAYAHANHKCITSDTPTSDATRSLLAKGIEATLEQAERAIETAGPAALDLDFLVAVDLLYDLRNATAVRSGLSLWTTPYA